MCCQNNTRSCRRGRSMSRQSGGSCCCCCCSGESAAPSATISMADYQPFILVPTTVFDQGDVDCGCANTAECGFDW